MTNKESENSLIFIPKKNKSKNNEIIRCSPSGIGLSNYRKHGSNTKGMKKKETIASGTIYSNHDERFHLTVEKQTESGKYLSMPTQKLFQCLIMKFGEQNNYGDIDNLNLEVEIEIDEYLRLIGKKVNTSSRDSCRKEIIRGIKIIKGHEIKFEEKRKNKLEKFNCTLIQSWTKPKGKVIIELSNKFAIYLNTTYRTFLPMRILRIDNRKPNAYHCATKLAEYASMYGNIKSGKFNIISVKSLLEACPEIPTYEEVKAGDRQYTRRIIEPLGNALDYLADIKIITWFFCNAKKEPITDKQLKQDYEELSKCYINFYLVNPDSQKVLEDQSQ